MAQVINVRHLKTHTEFNLSNKPDLLCKIDTEDFYEHVEHRTRWYIHISTKKTQVNRHYIRTSWSKSSGHRYLHREVLGIGRYNKEENVIGDHVTSTETLDNRSSNLRVTDTYGNARNRVDKENYKYSEPHKGYNIAKTKSGYYQAYLKKRYMGSNKCIIQLRKNIDIKLKQLNNEQKEK